MQSATILGQKVLKTAKTRGQKPVKVFNRRLKLHQSLVSSLPLDKFTTLISEGEDIDAIDHDGQTPLHLATFLDMKSHVQLLIEKRALLNVKDKNGDTAVHLACETNHVDCLKLLVDNSADVNVTNNDGRTPLHVAAENSNSKVVELLLDVTRCKCDVKDNSTIPMRPFDIALKNGDGKSVKFFILRGADVNKKTPFGRPIQIAINSGKTELIKTILKFKPKLNVTDQEGNTPLHLAVLAQVLLNVKTILKENNVNIDAVNGRGKTPLHLAAINKKTEIVRFLVNSGANCLIQDDCGNNPLHEICKSKYANFLEACIIMQRLGKGTQFNTSNFYGETPIYLAIRKKNKKLVMMFRFFYADSEESRMLHDAILSGDTELVLEVIRDPSASKSTFGF